MVETHDPKKMMSGCESVSNLRRVREWLDGWMEGYLKRQKTNQASLAPWNEQIKKKLLFKDVTTALLIGNNQAISRTWLCSTFLKFVT